MKCLLALCFIVIIQITSSQNVGYSDLIKYGPNKYVVGRNIVSFQDYLVYNIEDPSQDHTVLQKAINNIILRGGGEVLIKEGVYNFDKNIYLGNRVHLKGEGTDKTILRLKDYASAFITNTNKKTGFIKVKLSYSTVISDLTLDGNKCNQYGDYSHQFGRHGVFLEGCTHVWINNVKAINWQGYGLNFRKYTVNGEWGRYLTISNSVMENNDLDGAAVSEVANIFVVNNVAQKNGGHGVDVKIGSENVTIINNILIDNGHLYYPLGGCGVMVQNNRATTTTTTDHYTLATVSDNTLTNNFRAGVCTNDAQYVHVINNNLKNCISFNFAQTYSSVVESNLCETNRMYVTSKGSELNTSYSGNFQDLDQNTLNIFVRNNVETSVPCVKENKNTLCNYSFPIFHNETDDTDSGEGDGGDGAGEGDGEGGIIIPGSTGPHASTGAKPHTSTGTHVDSSTGDDKVEQIDDRETSTVSVPVVAIVVPIVIAVVIIVAVVLIKFKCFKKN